MNTTTITEHPDYWQVGDKKFEKKLKDGCVWRPVYMEGTTIFAFVTEHQVDYATHINVQSRVRLTEYEPKALIVARKLWAYETKNGSLHFSESHPDSIDADWKLIGPAVSVNENGEVVFEEQEAVE